MKYRPIDKTKDDPQDGDEFLDTESGTWHLRIVWDFPFSGNYEYRRPIKEPEYRMLKIGEIIQEGDEVLECDWVKVTVTDVRVSLENTFRRPVTAEDDLRERIKELEAEVASLKPITYKAGDRFKDVSELSEFLNDGTEYILAKLGGGKMALIHLGDGEAYSFRGGQVSDSDAVTQSEFNEIVAGNGKDFVRI